MRCWSAAWEWMPTRPTNSEVSWTKKTSTCWWSRTRWPVVRRRTRSCPPRLRVRSGQVGVCWGSTDFVSLVKELVLLDKNKDKYDKFVASGGVMDGERLDAERLKEVSKWPSRDEQISLLVGQILAPGANYRPHCLGRANCSIAKSRK